MFLGMAQVLQFCKDHLFPDARNIVCQACQVTWWNCVCIICLKPWLKCLTCCKNFSKRKACRHEGFFPDGTLGMIQNYVDVTNCSSCDITVHCRQLLDAKKQMVQLEWKNTHFPIVSCFLNRLGKCFSSHIVQHLATFL